MSQHPYRSGDETPRTVDTPPTWAERCAKLVERLPPLDNLKILARELEDLIEDGATDASTDGPYINTLRVRELPRLTRAIQDLRLEARGVLGLLDGAKKAIQNKEAYEKACRPARGSGSESGGPGQ